MFETFITDYGCSNAAIYKGQKGEIYLHGSNKLYVSLDNGRIWESIALDDNGSEERKPFAHSNTSMRMSDGRLMMAVWDPTPEIVKEHNMNGSTFSMVFSDDEGITASESYPLCKEIGCYYIMNDRLLRLKSSRIILPICKHPTERFGAGVENEGMVTTAYSDDGGKTWAFGEWKDGNYQEPMVVQREDETLLMYMRSKRGFMSVSKSYDEGEHWTEPELTDMRMPCAPFCVKKDMYSGYIFVIWIDSFPAEKAQFPRTPLCMAVSRDDGETFEKVCVIENNPAQGYGYPCILFDKDEILISYYVNNASNAYCDENQRIKLKVYSRHELAVEQITKVPLFD